MCSIIFGVAGQCGSFLAEQQLSLGFQVIGVGRKDIHSYPDYINQLSNCKNFTYIAGDATDPSFVSDVIRKFKPKEIYNLAGQSSVYSSFGSPNSTFRTNVESCLNVLEGVRQFSPDSRVFQACSSEMYGDGGLKNEEDEMRALSPYGISKLACHRLIDLYRSRHDVFGVSGILFNCESYRRSYGFVTRKIAQYVANVYKSKNKNEKGFHKLKLGNLGGTRDFGYAPSFCRGFHAALLADVARDYVFATGILTSVAQLCKDAFDYIGEDYTEYVDYDKTLERAVDAGSVVGDSSRAKLFLGWKNNMEIEDVLYEMIEHEKKL